LYMAIPSSIQRDKKMQYQEHGAIVQKQL
jgi:hypothetical protein